MFLTKKESVRLAFILSLLVVALLAAKSASAAVQGNGVNSGALIVFTQASLVKGGNVSYTFEVGSTLDKRSPYGGTLALSTCHEGQTEIKMAHRTRHLSNGESLRLDKVGNLVWYMPTIPASGGLNRLSITFQLPRGKGGPLYCLRVSVQAYGDVSLPPLSYEAPVSLG